jgi:hypothetical protein
MMCMSKSQEDDIMTLVSVEDHPIGSVKGACVRILFRGVRVYLVDISWVIAGRCVCRPNKMKIA